LVVRGAFWKLLDDAGGRVKSTHGGSTFLRAG